MFSKQCPLIIVLQSSNDGCFTLNIADSPDLFHRSMFQNKNTTFRELALLRSSGENAYSAGPINGHSDLKKGAEAAFETLCIHFKHETME
jgi:hypothetical protein